MRPREARTARRGETQPTAADFPDAEMTVADARTRPTRRGRPAAPTAPPPMVLERYQLQRRLGSGAFGTVWMARDERLERDVAVKILPRERIVGGRFEREARVAARLSHPGIVTLYEASIDDDGAYLVSELVRGSTLDRLLEAGRLSDRDIVDIGIALCDALDHAHEEGIIHRDVKPSNVLIPQRPSSSAQLARLTDFGVARVLDGGDALTRTGDVIGTLSYMAPEQAEGMEAGPSADLYSLALVLYEALTGVNPLAVGATAGPRARRLGAYLPPLRRQRRDLPRALGAAIDMALRPRVRERGRLLDLRRALVIAQDTVGEEAGVVGDPWDEPDEPEPFSQSSPSPRMRRARGDRAAPEAEAYADDAELAGASAPLHRGLAALCAAGATAWLAAHGLRPSPLPPPVLAFAAAALTLLLPRIGWLTVTLAAGVLTALQGHFGLTLLLVPAGLLPALLVPWRATSWPLAAVAVALGLVGVAGAWPALAGRAASVWRRAALGATGWIWLLVAAPIVGHGLYLDWVPGSSGAIWSSTVRDTTDLVLTPLVNSGALAPAAVWAVAAAVLPWLVRGRSLISDGLSVVVWSATVVAGSTAAIGAMHGGAVTPTAPAAVLGAVLGAAVALAPVWLPASATTVRWPRAPFAGSRSRPVGADGPRRQFP